MHTTLTRQLTITWRYKMYVRACARVCLCVCVLRMAVAWLLPPQLAEGVRHVYGNVTHSISLPPAG